MLYNINNLDYVLTNNRNKKLKYSQQLQTFKIKYLPLRKTI